jgi:hypothetical protein
MEFGENGSQKLPLRSRFFDVYASKSGRDFVSCPTSFCAMVSRLKKIRRKSLRIRRVFDTGFETFELFGGDGEVTLRISASSSSANIEEALKAENITPNMQKKLTQWLKKVAAERIQK